MKRFKLMKLISVALLATMSLSFVGCGKTEKAEGGYKAGVYSSEVKAHNGKMIVEVTFDETSITKVEIKEHAESAGISDRPIEDIPKQIVEGQTLKIDSVTGATYTSDAIIEAVALAVTEAGGDAEALKKVEAAKKDEKKEKVEKEADVIVVGGGSAGLAAAVSAAEEGASVIVVEKNPFLGGNSIRTAGGYAVVDQEYISQHLMNPAQMAELESLVAKETDNETVKQWQAKVAQDIEEYKAAGRTDMYDSVEFCALQFYFRFGQSADADLLYDMVANSDDMRDWLASMGFPWVETPNMMIGDNWPRWGSSSKHKGGDGYIEVFQNEIKDKNYDVEIITDLKAEELVIVDNKVVGVKGTKVDGTPYEFSANNGVVLATGGFSANSELLKEYSDGRWENIELLGTSNDPAMVGDGLKMGLSAGADLFDIAHVQVLPIADPENGDTKSFIGSTTNMYVNKEGKRFVDESKDRDTLSNAILKQTDAEIYVVSSSDNDGIDDNGYTLMGRYAQDLIDAGKVLKADTLEELAEKMGVDVDTFMATVAQFNEAVETGVDKEFGRPTFAGDIANPNGTPALINGPFYACLRTPVAHITKGGLKVDIDARVMSTEGNAIEGLFAAGEVTGGRSVAGLLEAITTGYRAGKTVAK